MNKTIRKLMLCLFSAGLLGICSAAVADEALAKSKNCLACHAVDKKVVGPSFKDVAKKYASNAKAVDVLSTKILKGGSGNWGAIPMPANPQVSEAESRALAQWMISLQ